MITPPKLLRCGRFALSLERPLIMGILNVTPDSFSDGGRYLTLSRAIERAEQMIVDGADIIDVGGESTRPNAPEVTVQMELDRVMPVLTHLLKLDVPISLDTRKTAVMAEALRSGIDMVNDVGALEDAGALELVARSTAAVCLMHKRGDPQNMQHKPIYNDVVSEVSDYLQQRAEEYLAAGGSRDKLLIDPGFGFGKTLAHNISLLRDLPALTMPGYPLLVGLSRKSMLGAITGNDVANRLHESVAAAMLAVQRGAAVVRVHDVKPTRDALTILRAIES